MNQPTPEPAPVALEVDDLSVAYGDVEAVAGASLQVPERSLVALLGANGAGKTTLLSAIAGLLRPRAGAIRLAGQDITGVPAHRVSRQGLRLVPESRALFGDMTVAENLAVGLAATNGVERQGRLDRVFTLFPVLEQRKEQTAGTMSGGEQQMLSIARALVADPKVLVLDEPSMGLAPLVVTSILDAVASLRDQGLTVVVAEQNARAVLRVADQAVLMARGRTVAQDSADAIARHIEGHGYLGTSAPGKHSSGKGDIDGEQGRRPRGQPHQAGLPAGGRPGA